MAWTLFNEQAEKIDFFFYFFNFFFLQKIQILLTFHYKISFFFHKRLKIKWFKFDALYEFQQLYQFPSLTNLSLFFFCVKKNVNQMKLDHQKNMIVIRLKFKAPQIKHNGKKLKIMKIWQLNMKRVREREREKIQV